MSPNLSNVTPLRSEPSASRPKIFLSPYLKKVARELNITDKDLAKIKGQGPEGRITEQDLKNFRSTSATPGVLDPKMEAIRARIAENLTKSKRDIPHAGAGVEIDLTPLYEEYQKLKVQASQKHGVKLTLFVPFSYAAVQILKTDPYLNSVYAGEGKVQILTEVNLGISVAGDQGLLVPVLKSAQGYAFVDFWKKFQDLIERTRTRKIKPDEMIGGTFTVNNPGALGSDKILQIIPPGQVAILGFNRVVQKPAVVEGKVVPRYMMNVDLQFDHRVADGREALRFLTALKKQIEGMKLESLMSF